MVTEALSSEETTVEAAITAVSGLSSYFSAVVALAVAATAIKAADVAAAADLNFLCGAFRPAAFFDFSDIAVKLPEYRQDNVILQLNGSLYLTHLRHQIPFSLVFSIATIIAL